MDNLVIIMFIAIIVVGIGLIILMSVGKKGNKSLNKERYQNEWLKIEQSVTSDPNTQQFAIFQADKLLDKALKESGFKGNNMGERLTSASRSFSKPDVTWAAHKLRNRIAHDSDVKISVSLTRRALASFKKSLRDLGAL